MPSRIDNNIEIELHDVFHVQQVTRDTPLEEDVGADLVTLDPGQASDTHRHNFSETVLFFTSGRAIVHINNKPHYVKKGDRILIHKTEFHSVSTYDDGGCGLPP